MNVEAEREFENFVARVDWLVGALQQRTVWTSPLVQSSMTDFMASEAESLRADKDLYTFSELSAADKYAAMGIALQQMADAVQNQTDATEYVEARLWTLLEEWLDARSVQVEFLAFERSTSHPTIELPDSVAAAIAPARAARARARSVLYSLLRLHQEVQESDSRSRIALAEASAANEERRQAQDLAAKSGDSALSEEFTKLADEQASAAFGWTALSILTTAVGIVLGGIAHFQVQFQSSEAQLIYPLLIALGAGGLATYFARLGGHHRHSAAWAKSIAVQLDSYAKFVENTNSEGKMRVFDQFAGRVLGAPPPRSEKAAVQSAMIADIAAIVAKNPT